MFGLVDAGAVSAVTTSIVWLWILLPVAKGSNGYNVDTPENIKKTAKTLAEDMWAFYEPEWEGKEPGILPGPPDSGRGNYYWWQGGALMGTYMDYWHYTGDDSYNDEVTKGMLAQVGDYNDYQPVEYYYTLGNDDQAFWGMSAMLAAEIKFPDPPEDKPQWLALAQAVWVTQANPERHDEFCNGGLRWQIPELLNRVNNYKNTISNGCFFNLGARLARYTGNETYAKHAEETWNWLWGG
jgi:mannan endo-1,6-alpha-mannosidase